jgi:hypothetical protein
VDQGEVIQDLMAAVVGEEAETREAAGEEVVDQVVGAVVGEVEVAAIWVEADGNL